RRRHTRFDCDWSSDVCSSDLIRCGACRLNLVPSVISNCLFSVIPAPAAVLLPLWVEAEVAGLKRDDLRSRADNHEIARATASPQIGRASCRERGWIAVVEVFV